MQSWHVETSVIDCTIKNYHFIGCDNASEIAVIPKSGVVSNEAFVLTLPGKTLDLSQLVNIKKKFRHRGGKDGALSAMKKLEDGMGKLVVKKSKGSVKVCNCCIHVNINRVKGSCHIF